MRDAQQSLDLRPHRASGGKLGRLVLGSRRVACGRLFDNRRIFRDRSGCLLRDIGSHFWRAACDQAPTSSEATATGSGCSGAATTGCGVAIAGAGCTAGATSGSGSGASATATAACALAGLPARARGGPRRPKMNSTTLIVASLGFAPKPNGEESLGATARRRHRRAIKSRVSARRSLRRRCLAYPWFDQQDVRFFFRDRQMLDLLRHDEDFARPKVTSRSRKRMVSLPLSTRKKSSVSACECQTNSPLTFTTIRSWPLNAPTTRGAQCSSNCASLSARLILSPMAASGVRENVDVFPAGKIERRARGQEVEARLRDLRRGPRAPASRRAFPSAHADAARRTRHKRAARRERSGAPQSERLLLLGKSRPSSSLVRSFRPCWSV